MRDSQANEDAPAKIPDRTFSAPNMKFNRLLFFSEYFASQCSDLESATRTVGTVEEGNTEHLSAFNIILKILRNFFSGIFFHRMTNE
jgi:hypothetical protein